MSQDVSPHPPTRWPQPDLTAHPVDRSSSPPTVDASPLGHVPVASEPWIQIPLYPPLSHLDREDHPPHDSAPQSPKTTAASQTVAAQSWTAPPDREQWEANWETTPGQFSVDAYADSLMNDLFGEVEHILDTGAAPPRAEDQPDFIAIKPLPVRQIHLPPELVPPPEEGSDPQVIEAEVTPVTPWGDRVLQGAVILSCGMALGLSLVDPDRYTPAVMALRGESPLPIALAPAVDPVVEAQQQFIRYLERSLELLEQKETELAQAETGATPAGTPAAAGTAPAPPLPPGTLPPPNFSADLPTVAVASTLPGQTVLPPVGLANPNPPTVLERVYIPAYGNAPGANTGMVSPIPGLTLNPPTLPPVAPAAPPASTPALAPVPLPPAAPGPAAAAIATALPTTTHTLMGLLELGDRSAALFEINGVTRRIHLGESIGSSGWTLVEVANQEAIMRRNGEVRSVYVGQSF